MEAEEIEWWEEFASSYRAVEVEQAFDSWLRNRGAEEWWPTAQRFAELCRAYRYHEKQKSLPIGCPRCEWTGWYMTAAPRTIAGNEVLDGRKLAAECPCQRDVSLRTPHAGRLATQAEMRAMWQKVWELCDTKSMNRVGPVHKAQSAIALTKEQIEQRKEVERAEIERVRKQIEE